MHYAILKDEINESVEFLLEHCDDITVENNNGENVLHIAAKSLKNVNLWQLLLHKVTVVQQLSKKNFNGETPLRLAVTNNNFPFVKAMIDHIDSKLSINPIPVSIDYDKMNKETLIDHCLAFLTVSMTRWYKDYPPNAEKLEILNQIDQRTQRTALFCAINSKNLLMSLFLLVHLADPNIADLSGSNCYTLVNDLTIDRKFIMAMSEIAAYYKTMDNKLTKRKSKEIINFLEKRLKDAL